MKKLVNVDSRKDEYIVTSYTQMASGIWKMNGHFRRVPLSSGQGVLGRALLEALDVSNVVPLEDLGISDNPFAPVLRELGLKSFSQYMKAVASVGLAIGNDEVLKVTPKRNGGAREGFVEIVDKARVVMDRSASSIAHAVEQAMNHALRS